MNLNDYSEKFKEQFKEEAKSVQELYIREIQQKANLNIVTCGNCGSVLIHRQSDEKIICYDCLREMAVSDCPDLFT